MRELQASHARFSDRPAERTNKPNLGPLARGALRRFIVVWSGLIVAAFIALCIGQVALVSRLHAQTNRIAFDGQSLHDSGAFESAILERSLAPGLVRMPAAQDSDDLLKTLQREADSPAESILVARIAHCYHSWQQEQALASQAARTSRTQRALPALLEAVRAHRHFNTRQMQQTQQSSERLDKWVDRVSLGLILVTGALVLVGVVELWTRVFRPIQDLVAATRAVAQGHWSTRVPIRRDDEMGQLARTFNTMTHSMAERERERLEFVATVAHDLKNPLTVIGGAAHLMARKDEVWSPQERREWLDRIASQAHKLEGLIGDLTDGVQAHTGQMRLHCGPLDLAVLVQEAIAAHRETCNHGFEYCGPASCELQGDARRLERVIFNLLSNAVKYSPYQSCVKVTLQIEPQRARLRVQDEGAGIAAEDLPRLFLPFSRLESTRAATKGTGLGLSSVKKIVEAHGGHIQVHSRLNHGTTFEVLLSRPA